MAGISRRTALLALVGIGIGASGCTTGSSEPGGSASPSMPSGATTSAAPTANPSPTPPVDTRPRWPLTGKLVSDPKATRHAAVAVKVPDNRNEHPQRGIDEADIVFVELEGYRDPSGYSSTRLMPVFHSSMADTVAPVRSIRPVDVPLLSPMNAVIGNTGAAGWVINYVRHHRAHLEGMLSYMLTKGTGSYGINAARIYRLNGTSYYDRAVTCHPGVLAKQSKRFRGGPPQPYFPFATGDEKPSTVAGTRGRSVRIPYKGDGYVMSYRYDASTKRYLRSMPWGPHLLADGTRVSTDNILIIKARQRYGKVFRGRGKDEPLHDIINAGGTFHYFNRGRYVSGRWSKARVQDPFVLTLADGTPLRMAPGRTFVELPASTAKLRIAA